MASAKVRMYRLKELGDCFLITFTASGQTSRMLIDCGSFRNSGASKARLQQIADAIRAELSGASLDVVVGTHQHNDHVSGFVHCERTFRAIGIEQVWLSWLDDPTDRKATGIGEEHKNLVKTLHAARKELGNKGLGIKGSRAREVLEDVLGFYGAKGASGPPVLPATAVEILKKLGRKKPKYLRPGSVVDMPGLPTGSVRVHVLGPPREEGDELLYRKNPRKGESYDHSLAMARLSADKFLAAVANRARTDSARDDQYPFGQTYKRRGKHPRCRSPLKDMVQRYDKRGDGWRTIGDDWMGQAESLALYLDTFTNNSSLVLAIELVESGKVLLFAADAQSGNWLSWSGVKWERKGVKTDDLLARTVFYKVGHHASHNATLVAAFEKMTHPDLVALIPVHRKDPNIKKKNGWKMPAKNLFKRLAEKTEKRVLRMDTNAPDCDPAKNPAKASWMRVGIKPKIKPLYIELDISGS